MKFSKQIKSLDRRIATLRKYSSTINKLYNHILNININHSFHSEVQKNKLAENANQSINKLLEPTKILRNNNNIPKIIWIFWDSGFDNAPDVVHKSVYSWKEMNPDYEVKLLSNDNLDKYLDFDFNCMFYLSSIHCLPAIKSDILRLYLLSKYGGVWADATTFCLQPLSFWLKEASSYCGLFTFRHKYNNTRPIEVWFIASSKASPIINNTLAKIVDYIFKSREYSLFISGKLSLISNTLIGDDVPQNSQTIINAEKLGFMPYFSTGYFFYESLEEHLSSEKLSIFLRSTNDIKITNNHALTKDDFNIFSHSLVSKQTYTNSYMESALYKTRLQYLYSQLESKSDVKC
ncbi:capsular polysaccharide synthesis protein [Vibrio hibernica]|uniref:capsular polysaccharide synthesis protein n=1 Tax=Vibrio hibernica TaxID=2587465 RepID=UPI0018820652|nr:capsular polysaccharide synthesis protein [Vibrio hibernica]